MVTERAWQEVVCSESLQNPPGGYESSNEQQMLSVAEGINVGY